jgi:hypothetical protein
MRRGIESLAATGTSITYYELRIASITRVLLEKG